MLAVRRKVAVAHELEAVAGQAGLELAGLAIDATVPLSKAGCGDWRGALLTLRISGGPQARLGIVVPDDELLTDAVTIRDRALLATLLVAWSARDRGFPASVQVIMKALSRRSRIFTVRSVMCSPTARQVVRTRPTPSRL